MVQSGAVVVPPVPADEPPEKTFFTCQVESLCRPAQLLGEHARVGRGLDALPDVAAGLLVVAVAGVQRRREADVDLGLGHADDPRDAPQRLALAPEVLGQRRALVVEEVDAVEVEDVDGARAVVGDAVLVLAAQPERRADLRADRVAAALATGDHDDPAADAVALVPDPARADDAGVVVGMGPLAHHVDLHRVRGLVRPLGGHGDRQPDRHQHGQSNPEALHPSLPHSFEHLRTAAHTRPRSARVNAGGPRGDRQAPSSVRSASTCSRSAASSARSDATSPSSASIRPCGRGRARRGGDQRLRSGLHRRGVRALGAEQVDVALLLLPRPAREPDRVLAPDQRVEHVLHGGEVGEPLHPLRPLLELAGRLRAAQQQHGEHGELAVVEAERLVEQVAELVGAARVAAREPRVAALGEPVQRLADHRLVVFDDRVAVRRLVAREPQRVQAERVLVRRRALLLDQAAEDAHLDRVEVHHRHASGAGWRRRTFSNATGLAVITPSTHQSISRRQVAGLSPSSLSQVCHA